MGIAKDGRENRRSYEIVAREERELPRFLKSFCTSSRVMKNEQSHRQHSTPISPWPKESNHRSEKQPTRQFILAPIFRPLMIAGKQVKGGRTHRGEKEMSEGFLNEGKIERDVLRPQG